MHKGLQAFFACCAAIIACASIIATTGSLTGLSRKSAPIVADPWSPARSKIIEELVRTRVEVERGLNMTSFHAHLVEIETDATIAGLSHSLSDGDLQVLNIFISKFSAADALWQLSNDPDGPCRLNSAHSREFIYNSTGCLIEVKPLIEKIGETAGYLETAAAGDVLRSQDVRQPALTSAGKSLDAAIVSFTNNISTKN